MLTTLLTFTRLTYPCGSAAVQELLIQEKKSFITLEKLCK